MTEVQRKWSRRAGLMLAACSVAYVAVRLVEYRAELAAAEVPPAVWLALPAFALLYAAAGVLLACAWRELLAAAGQHVALRWSVTTHGLSQLGKYLPGNVFQFVSRQFIGAAGGLPHGVLVRSSLHELLGLAAAGVLLSVWALPLLDNRLGWLSAPPVAGLTLAGALAGARLLAGARIARALAAHLLFLLAAAGIFLSLLGMLSVQPAAAGWLPLCGAYTAAWLAGFATPGAPAGLGVRELALLVLLGGQVDAETLLLAVALGRVVTVLGDAVLFGATAWAARRQPAA